MVDIPASASPASATSGPRPVDVDWGWRIISGAVAAFAGLTLVACLSGYSASDPSWNTASNLPVSNPTGAVGAVIADLLTQLTGWGGLIGGVALLVAGIRRTLFLGRVNASRWVWGALAVGLLVVALAAAPRPPGWLSPVGLGGLIGHGVLSFLVWPFEAVGLPAVRPLLGLAAFGASAVLAGVALGIQRQDADAGLAAAARLGRGVLTWLVRVAPPVGRGMLAVCAWLGRISLDLGQRAFQRRRVAAPAAVGVDALPDAPMGPLFSPHFLFEPEDSAEPAHGPAAVTARAATPAEPPLPAPALSAPAPRVSPVTPQPTPRNQTVVLRSAFALPAVDILGKPPARRTDHDTQRLLDDADRLTQVLSEYAVKGRVLKVHPGPVVTQFEFEPAAGVRTQRIVALADDIARSMSAQSARVAVMHGRNAVGIELPNRERETVFLRGLLQSDQFTGARGGLPLALGENISGEPVIADLMKMPHLLIAGTTGSGKSVGINAMILSLLYRFTPQQCRFIMIDPKMLELSVYEGIPHLLAPVVTDPQKAVLALKWVVREMDDRYSRMAQLGVRGIGGYNELMEEARRAGRKVSFQVASGVDEVTGELLYEMREQEAEHLPYIVVVVDEMADLMMVAGKEVEINVQRIVQKARAAGIHMITATQRPSVDVITGTIKANFPTRISYMVRSRVDSRTILDEMGAEQLLGNGDLLYMAAGGRTVRLHGPFVSDAEVAKVATHLKAQGAPRYVTGVFDDPDAAGPGQGSLDLGDGEEEDIYRQIVATVLNDKRPTTSYVQRQFNIGYNRAAKYIERMERDGYLSAPDHNKNRRILRQPGELD